MVRRIRPLFALALLITAYFSVATPGSADTNSPFWTCRGTVGYLGSTDPTKPGRIEPMVANAGDPSTWPALQAAVEEKLKDRFGVAIKVEVVAPGALDALTEVNHAAKLKRFRDER